MASLGFATGLQPHAEAEWSWLIMVFSSLEQLCYQPHAGSDPQRLPIVQQPSGIWGRQQGQWIDLLSLCKLKLPGKMKKNKKKMEKKRENKEKKRRKKKERDKEKNNPTKPPNPGLITLVWGGKKNKNIRNLQLSHSKVACL